MHDGLMKTNGMSASPRGTVHESSSSVRNLPALPFLLIATVAVRFPVPLLQLRPTALLQSRAVSHSRQASLNVDAPACGKPFATSQSPKSLNKGLALHQPCTPPPRPFQIIHVKEHEGIFLNLRSHSLLCLIFNAVKKVSCLFSHNFFF